MIKTSANHIIALLADRRLCCWDKRHTVDAVPKILVTDPVLLFGACSSTDVVSAITNDGRFLWEHPDAAVMVDSSLVIMEPLGETDCSSVQQLVAGNDSFIIQTDQKVYRLRLIRDPLVWSRYASIERDIYETCSEIDTVSCGDDYGFIKSKCGRLFSFGTNTYCERGIDHEDLAGEWMHEVAFDNTQNIQSIHCGFEYTVILMKDGQVFACGKAHGHIESDTQGSPRSSPKSIFNKVVFDKDDIIVKVVAGRWRIIYISHTGQCYYTEAACMWNYYKTEPQTTKGLCPIKLPVIDRVEDAFIVTKFVFIQYNGGKLSMLHLLSKDKRQMIDLPYMPPYLDPKYLSGKRMPTKLDFFDDKLVVAVNHSYKAIYFITDTGQVYYSSDHKEMAKLNIGRMHFFDDNPVAVVDTACQIRSAGSVV